MDATIVIDERLCKECGEYYPITQYNVKDTKTGRRSNVCNACTRAALRLKYTNSKDGDFSGVDGSYSPADPWKDLCCAVLMQAINDWKAIRRFGHFKKAASSHEIERQRQLLRNYTDARAEMLTFFWSQWFEYLCDIAGYSPEWVREKLGVPRMLV